MSQTGEKRLSDDAEVTPSKRQQRPVVTEEMLKLRTVMFTSIWSIELASVPASDDGVNDSKQNVVDIAASLTHCLRVAQSLVLHDVPAYVLQAAIMHDVIGLLSLTETSLRSLLPYEAVELILEMIAFRFGHMTNTAASNVADGLPGDLALLETALERVKAQTFLKLSPFALLVELASIADVSSDLPSLKIEASKEEDMWQGRPNGRASAQLYTKSVYAVLDSMAGTDLTYAHREFIALIETNFRRLGYLRVAQNLQ